MILLYSCAGDEVIVGDSEGSFDAANRLKSASDVLLIAAGSGTVITTQNCIIIMLT